MFLFFDNWIKIKRKVRSIGFLKGLNQIKGINFYFEYESIIYVIPAQLETGQTILLFFFSFFISFFKLCSPSNYYVPIFIHDSFFSLYLFLKISSSSPRYIWENDFCLIIQQSKNWRFYFAIKWFVSLILLLGILVFENYYF